jgi:hypothetical protein
MEGSMSYKCVAEEMHEGVYCVVVDAQCDICRRKLKFYIPETEWLAWTLGDELIQNAMPSLPMEDREVLISGTCGVCFDAMFADEEDD